MPDSSPVRLRILWPNPVPTQFEGHPSEFGMQKGRDGLLPGIARPEGSTAYETEVTPYRDKAGRLRFRGECVQGPPDEPFLYLSHRFAGTAGGWIGRGKALLLPLDEAFLATVPAGATLEHTMHRLGHRDPGVMTRWTIAHPS